MRKTFLYVAIAFSVFYLLSQPTSAAATVHAAFSLLGDAGDALAQFVNSLS